MRKLTEWVLAWILSVVTICLLGLIIWAILVATWAFIVTFVITLGPTFIYLLSIGIITGYTLIRLADSEPEIYGK
jgi:hypothetical protein